MKFRVLTNQDIDDIIERIIKREGGARVTNHRNDPGGWTKFGITAGTLGDWLKLGRDATEAEVRALTLAEAIKIYRRKYYEHFRIGRLPADLQEPVMDACVTSGSHGIKILQRLLNKLLTIDDLPLLAVDGGLGNKTLDQVAVYYSREPVLFRDFYSLSRIGFFLYIANRNAKLRVFIKGWITKRGNVFITKPRRFKMARVKQLYDWG